VLAGVVDPAELDGGRRARSVAGRDVEVLAFVRELQRVIENVICLAQAERVGLDDLPPGLREDYETFLLEHGVEPWRDLPLWIPASDDEMAYFHRTDVSKAVAAGLTFRPLEETARAVPQWNGAAGISPEREAELLGEWTKVAA